MPDITLTTITEQDVDMLLLEEFASSPAFARWFAKQCSAPDMAGEPVLGASRGVLRSSGESDLEVALLQADGSVHYILIENKINAAFQPRQAWRYQERGESYRREDECKGFTTVLVAPEDYIRDRTDRFGFDHYISYEVIRKWFEEQSESDPRTAVKLAVLFKAIEKSKLGYVPTEHHPVTEFWKSYWKTCIEMAPELEMPEPGAKPSGAGFILFRPPALPNDIRLLHKLPHGNVDLQFSRMGGNLSVLWKQFASHLESDMAIKPANNSGAIRIKVPVLDTSAAFEAQKESVREGIEAARRLLKWYVSVNS